MQLKHCSFIMKNISNLIFALFLYIECVKAQRLMVVGGAYATYEVDVLDLSGNNRHCRNLSNAPIDQAAVGTFMNGEAIVCNSYEEKASNGTCYIYDNSTDSWRTGPQTGLFSYWSAAAVINDGQEWWISGGASWRGDDYEELTNGTAIYDGTTFRPFMDLPSPDNLHHLVTVNSTHVIYIEGYNVGTAAIFDLTTNTWNAFTPLPGDKDDAFAGLATYPDGSRQLVVAGGVYDTGTWIYELDSGIDLWRPGPDLEQHEGASVPYGDTFFAVGGRINHSPWDWVDLVWEYNPNPADEKWILRPERLETNKNFVAAFMVPDNYATC